MIAFLVLVALCFFGPRIFDWAIRADRADYHLAHKPGSCRECDSYE